VRHVLLLLLVLPALLPACAVGDPDHVRIGVVGALSGPRAYLGTDVVRGAELAVEDINAAGGLLGHDVELVVRDASDLVDVPGQLADLAERERVSAVIGPDAPGVLLGPRSPLTRRGVPALLPTAFAGDLGEAPAPVWRTVPSGHDQAAALAGWLVDERDSERVAVLVADPIEGPLARASVAAGLTAGGTDVVAVVEADAATPDLGPAVARLRREAPEADALVIWAPPPGAARVTRAVRDQGWDDVQIGVPSSAFVGEYRSLAAAASEGVVLPFPFREEWFTAEMERWMVRWHQRHGLDVLADVETLVLDIPVAAVAAYDAVQLVAAAVEESGSRDPRTVAAALEGLETDGLLRDYHLASPEGWTPEDLHVARFHNFAVVYDVDPALDVERQRRFYDYQVRLDYLPDEVLRGRAGEIVAELIEQRRADAPEYEPPAPPPGPVARPGDR
jgi:branched-chain amino acid transport system substrate-binding protein